MPPLYHSPPGHLPHSAAGPHFAWYSFSYWCTWRNPCYFLHPLPDEQLKGNLIFKWKQTVTGLWRKQQEFYMAKKERSSSSNMEPADEEYWILCCSCSLYCNCCNNILKLVQDGSSVRKQKHHTSSFLCLCCTQAENLFSAPDCEEVSFFDLLYMWL